MLILLQSADFQDKSSKTADNPQRILRARILRPLTLP